MKYTWSTTKDDSSHQRTNQNTYMNYEADHLIVINELLPLSPNAHLPTSWHCFTWDTVWKHTTVREVKWLSDSSDSLKREKTTKTLKVKIPPRLTLLATAEYSSTQLLVVCSGNSQNITIHKWNESSNWSPSLSTTLGELGSNCLAHQIKIGPDKAQVVIVRIYVPA